MPRPPPRTPGTGGAGATPRNTTKATVGDDVDGVGRRQARGGDDDPADRRPEHHPEPHVGRLQGEGSRAQLLLEQEREQARMAGWPTARIELVAAPTR